MYKVYSDSICGISVKLNNLEQKRKGTGFVFTNEHILSALHVLIDRENESVDDIEEIQVTSNSGRIMLGTVEKLLKDEDLVVVKTELASYLRPLTISGEIPEVGTNCFWCGYPMLIGERSSRRVRYGWGRVSSEPNESKPGIFEIDGNFSPGHSGAPVMDELTKSIIGVVSRSVGDPREHFSRYGKYVEALNFIAPHLNLPSQLLEFLENTMGAGRYDLPRDIQEFMIEGQVIVPILIVLAVGIFIGTRIWMMFRK